MHGKGKLYFPDSAIFTGIFKDNLPNGKGTYITPDGNRYKGLWRNGKFENFEILNTEDGVEINKIDSNHETLFSNYSYNDTERFNSYKIIFSVIIVLLLLFATFGGAPYGFYKILRVIVTGVSCFLMYIAFEDDRKFWLTCYVVIVIIFNPIIPIHLGRDLWKIIDLVTAVFFTISIFGFRLR